MPREHQQQVVTPQVQRLTSLFGALATQLPLPEVTDCARGGTDVRTLTTRNRSHVRCSRRTRSFRLRTCSRHGCTLAPWASIKTCSTSAYSFASFSKRSRYSASESFCSFHAPL